MKRRIILAIAAFAGPFIAIACARAPEPRTNATTDSNLEPGADASATPPATPPADASIDVAPRIEASAGGDARVPVPGLPMPQQFPHFVWDAAGAPRDAAAR